MKRPVNDQKGFTLLELMVAILILMVGLLAAASMQGVALNANALSNRISTSTMIAQQVMDDIYSWPNNSFILSAANVDYDLTPDPAKPELTLTIPSSGIYRATYTITPNASVSGVMVMGISRIDVTVTREDERWVPGKGDVSARGEKRFITLTSYKRTGL